MEMKQIIIFINPSKFYSLLGQHCATEIGFAARIQGNWRYLQNNKQIFYVKSEKSHAGDYSEAEAKSSLYILVPDQLKFEYTPELKSDFKVLYHSETKNNYPHQYERLKALPNCKGLLSSSEMEDTIYDTIAKQIRTGKNIEVDSVWKEIPEFSFTLESNLKLLHNCLTPEGAANADKLLLTEDQITIVESLAKSQSNFSQDYIDRLIELRTSLLGP